MYWDKIIEYLNTAWKQKIYDMGYEKIMMYKNHLIYARVNIEQDGSTLTWIYDVDMSEAISAAWHILTKDEQNDVMAEILGRS